MAEDEIVQRIVLTGNAEVIAAFAAIEAAGKKAFESITEAAKTLAGTDEATARIQETAAAIKEAQQGIIDSQAALAAAQTASNAATAQGMEKIVQATKKVEEAQAGLVAAQTAAGEAIGNKFGHGIRTATLLLAGLAAGVGIAVTGLFEFAKSAAASADTAGGLAEKFGDTVEKTDAFISGMASMGVSTGELGNAFRHMSFVIDNVFTEVKKQSRESADQLKGDALAIAQAESGLAEAVQKAATAQRDAALTRASNILSVADAQAKLDEVQAQDLKASGVDTSFLDQQNAALKQQTEYQHALLAVQQARAQQADAEEAAERKVQDAANAALKAQLDLSAAQRKADEDARNNIDNVAAAVKKLGEGAPDALKGIESSAENIVRGIVKNVGASASALEGFKGSLSDVNQASPTVKAALLAMADAFQHTEDNGLKTAVAMRFFGRSVGQDMIEGLSEGSAALLKAAARIEGLGLAVSKTDVEVGRGFRTAFTELSDTISHIADKVATQLQPPFTLAFSAINRFFEENNAAIRKWANDLGATAIPVVESFARVLLGVPDAAKDQWLLGYIQKLKDFKDTLVTVGGYVSAAAKAIGAFADDISHALNNALGTNLNAADVLLGAFLLRAVGGFSILGKAGEKLAELLGVSFLRLAGTLGAVIAALALAYEIYNKVKEAANQTPEQQKQIQEAHQKEKDQIQDAAQDFADKDITEKERDKRIAEAKEEYVRRKIEINKQSVASEKQTAHDEVTAKEEETKKWIEEETKKNEARQEALLKDQQAFKDRQVAETQAHQQHQTDELHPNFSNPQVQEARRQEVAATSGGSAVAGEGANVKGAGFGTQTKETSPLTEPSKNLDSAAGKLSGAADKLVSGSQKDVGNVQREAFRGVHTVEGDQALREAGKFDRRNIDGREIHPPAAPNPGEVGLPAPLDDQNFAHRRDIERNQQFNRDIARQGGERSPDTTYSDRPIRGHYDENGGFVRDRSQPGTPFERQNSQSGAPAPISFTEKQSVPLPQARPEEANPAPPIVQAIHESGDKTVQAIESTGKSGSAPTTEPPPSGQQQTQAIQQQTGILQQIFSTLSTLGDKIRQGAGGGGEGGAAQSEDRFKSSTDEASQGLTNFNSALQSLASAIQSMTAAAQAATAEEGAGTAGFAGGGHVQGAGTGTSDSIPAMVSHGEYIHTAKATEHYGVGFMNAINNLKLPKFSIGGLVGGLTSFAYAPVVPHFAGGGPVAAPVQANGGGGHMTVDLRTNAGDFHGLIAPDQVAKQLSRAAVQRQNVQTGSKPGWYKGKS